MSSFAVSLDKVKKDIISILKGLGIEAEEVASCNANIKLRKGYASYIYANDYVTLEAKLKSFVEDEDFKKSKSKVYVWSEYEGQYRYVQVGYFLPNEGGLTRLNILTVSVAQS